MRRMICRAKPWQVVLVFCLVYLGIILAVNHFDTQVFVTIGTCFAPCDGYSGSCPAGTTKGYDGQFAYFIARDPINVFCSRYWGACWRSAKPIGFQQLLCSLICWRWWVQLPC